MNFYEGEGVEALTRYRERLIEYKNIYVYRGEKMGEKIDLMKIDIFVIITLIMLVIAASFFRFTGTLNQNIDLKTQMYLSEITNESIELINAKVKEQFKSLDVMTLFIAQYENIHDNRVLDILYKYSKENKNTNVLVINQFGKAYSQLGNTYDVSDREYFQQALAGRPFISGNIISKMDKQQVVILAVPIHKDNKVIGVVAGVYSLDLFTEFINVETFDSEGYSIILRKDGQIISKPKKVVYENIFDEISSLKLAVDYDGQAIKDNFLEGKSGLFEYEYEGRGRYASYAPLGINDWSVLSIIPSDVVEKQHNEINKITTYLLIITAVCVSILTFCIIYITDKNKKEIRKKNMELARITRYMPGGAKRSLVDEGYTLLECTDGFLALTGYSRNEIEVLFDNKFMNMIYEQDRQDAGIMMENQRRSSSQIELEYRMLRKDGKLIWVLNKGQLVIDEYGRQNFYCVLLDITTQKEAQQQLEYEREKYKTVLDISEDIMFEYDIDQDRMIYSDKYNKLFARSPIINNFKQNLLETNRIHEQDCENVLDFFDKLINANSSQAIELRIKDVFGDYIWFRAEAVVIRHKAKPIKIIGKLSNINMHKRETDKLRKKSRRDSLTNLYNKGTTEQEIKNYFDNCGKEVTNALMLIDIDDFKGINDKLGHLVGDEALKLVASQLKSLFRASDIVGRIGGDEFVILAKDITSDALIFDKADAICNIFRQTYVGENKDYKVSGSIGIAVYPMDGLTYEELFKKADTALYNVKATGKDNYRLYDRSIEE